MEFPLQLPSVGLLGSLQTFHVFTIFFFFRGPPSFLKKKSFLYDHRVHMMRILVALDGDFTRF